MTTYITPSNHEKAEWSRMAQAAYAASLNSIGHRYSAAASMPNGAQTSVKTFDALQADYRAWLIGGFILTQQEASAQLPADAQWSCSFGYPGEERYSEYWRDATGARYVIAKDGHRWSFEQIA